MIEKEPLVSVIIPVYNGEKFIAETIESVILQTYKNWELFVVDDCSTDSTCKVVEKYVQEDTRIHLICSEENFGGPARPRNLGIARSQGEYIAFLDADDLWMPEKLERQLAVFQKYGDSILLVGTNVEIFPKGGKNDLSLSNDTMLSFHQLLLSPFSLTHKTNIINSAVLFRANIIPKIGLLDETKMYIAIEDYDYWLRILKYKDYSVYILKEDLVKYRIHGNNITTYNENKITHWEKLGALMKKKYSHITPLQKKIDQIPYFNLVYKTQMRFFAKQIGLVSLYRSDIQLKDKIIIHLKKIIFSIL